MYNLQCTSLAVMFMKIFVYPGDQMILEGAFDELVEQIWRKQDMNICPWKSMRKRLDIGYIFWFNERI